ncbi:MAG: hypothetical protein WCK11_01740 [Candidatus Falkowbacteria bacterium]
MGNWITLNFWFNSRPGELLGVSRVAVIISILTLVGVAIYSWWRNRQEPKNYYARIFSRLIICATTNAVIGLVLFFFSWQMIVVLSARFWYIIWLAGVALWVWLIYKDAKKIPTLRRAAEEKKEFKKYIP